MERLVRFSFQGYMDMYPEIEHRWMDPSDARAYIGHMNANWSGGHYSNTFMVLSREEALAFVDSDRCAPSCRDWLKKNILENY